MTQWCSIELSKLLDHVIGGDWGKEPEYQDESYVPVACIRGSEFRYWKTNFGSTASLRKIKGSSLDSRQLQPGDILVEISGGGPDQPVGRTVVITERVLRNFRGLPAVCTNFLRLARPTANVNPLYLNYYLTHFYASGEIVSYQGGSNNLRNLKFKDYVGISVPLPPLAEQKIIAAKLDELLAQVDTLKTRLDTIPKILKRFRQSVLAAAVSGRLTEGWRAQHPELTTSAMLQGFKTLPKPPRYKSRSTSFIQGVCATAVGLPKTRINNEWEWVQLVDVARMESGHTPSRDRPEYWGGEICWIGIKDARVNHEKIILDTEQKTNELGLANSASRLLPEGTVCISRTASVGYVVKMGKPMATSQDFVNWVPTEVVDSDWLKWLFVAETESLLRFGKGSTHTTIYFPEWLSMHVSLPHIEEQREIVRIVDRLLTYADQSEQQIKNAQSRVNRLTQSILDKAFRGELTEEWRAQDPDLISGENSAQTLLEGIRTNREATGQVKKTRKAKK